MKIIVIISFLIFCSCKQTTVKNINTSLNKSEKMIVKDTIVVHSDTISTNRKLKKDTIVMKSIIKHKILKIPFIRMEEGPSDSHFNGEPMIHQVDLASKVLQLYPDTLIHLAKQSYLNYEHYFPRSIQDNFEQGISTEQIYYPKLKFMFQLFENEYAARPYLEKQIIIIKERDGAIKAE